MTEKHKVTRALTSTERQRDYLTRLAESGGKTVRLDLLGDDLAKLDELVAHKKVGSRAECLKVLIRKAHQRVRKD